MSSHKRCLHAVKPPLMPSLAGANTFDLFHASTSQREVVRCAQDRVRKRQFECTAENMHMRKSRVCASSRVPHNEDGGCENVMRVAMTFVE